MQPNHYNVPPTERKLRQHVHPHAGRLPEPVATAVVEFLTGTLLEEPRRVGKPLVRQLEGYWSARRGAYRVVYAIDEVNSLILVVRIEHRADVYRPL